MVRNEQVRATLPQVTPIITGITIRISTTIDYRIDLDYSIYNDDTTKYIKPESKLLPLKIVICHNLPKVLLDFDLTK